jgi:predicted HAD superfamily Cof-like phosphohydrolase
MQEILMKVKHFQKTFKSPTANRPTLIPTKRSELRFALLNEENEEYLQAVGDNDIVEVADALGDMLYVIAGTIIEHGMQHIIMDIFNEIHASNMSKTDANGNPIINGNNGVSDPTRPFGKILKSDLYFQPNIKSVMKASEIKQSFNEITTLDLLDKLKAMKKSSDTKQDKTTYNEMIEKVNEIIQYQRS